MEDSELKKYASKIAEKLYSAKFKTVIHGDAKIANFMVADDFSKVAGLDFQWSGFGVGIVDVYYLLTSCFDEKSTGEYFPGEDEEQERKGMNQGLKFYFEQLKNALIKLDKYDENMFKELEKEWTYLYPFIVADLQRFILGWKPNYFKLTGYTKAVSERAVAILRNEKNFDRK